MKQLIRVWGVPLAPLTLAEAVQEIEALVQARTPSYVLSCNLNFAMLCELHGDLRAISAEAALILADGAPIVWASRLRGPGVPERVAGSDLIFAVAKMCAQRKLKVYFLGGAPGVAEAAAERLGRLYPGFILAGTACPSYAMSAAEEAAVVHGIREAGPDVLLAAFSQPKGERFIARHLEAMGVPVCIQLGAAIDFAADRVRRAPRWMQRYGLEWIYRLYLEPRRLFGRYLANGLFLIRMVARDLFRPSRSSEPQPPSTGSNSPSHEAVSA